jgi:adenine deaminase
MLEYGGFMIDLDRFKNRSALIDVAAGRKPGDFLLTNCRIANVFTSRIETGSVLVSAGKIAALSTDPSGGGYAAGEVIDLDGAFVLPGLIDSHVHIESSLLIPSRFAQLVLPRGTTSVIADPHEIANVSGDPGIRFMVADAARTPLNCFFMVPSCVPATPFEHSGAVLDALAIRDLLEADGILGLGEVMDYPAVIAADSPVIAKIEAAGSRNMPIDGHGPMIGGKELMAYLAAGIQSDHECGSAEEAEARLAAGMRILIREGSAAKNLYALLPAVNSGNARRCSFCTDDKQSEDILQEGHIDHILRLAVAKGLDAVRAVQMATLNAAEAYGLSGKGGIAPGWDADMAIVNNLKEFRVLQTWSAGKLVAADGESKFRATGGVPPYQANSVNIRTLNPDSFALPLKSELVNIIHIHPGSLITEKAVRRVHLDGGGFWQPDERLDICKLAVIERHHGTGNIGLGLAEGYGLKRGAVATTIAHDSHNLLVIGRNDEDMLAAAGELRRCGGGIALSLEGKVIGSLALPVAGLMADAPGSKVSAKLAALLEIAKDRLGVSGDIDPFMTLSFLALPVIPSIKLTDRGLFDVDNFRPMDINA